MSYIFIPLQQTPNQTFSCILDGQSAVIELETTDYGLFMTASYNGVSIASSRLCLDRTNINSAGYLGMPQALFFVDLQGNTDPVWTGFGTRYMLCYGNPQENGGTIVG